MCVMTQESERVWWSQLLGCIPQEDLAVLFDTAVPLEKHTPLVLTAEPAWSAFMSAARLALWSAAEKVDAAHPERYVRGSRYIEPPLQHEASATFLTERAASLSLLAGGGEAECDALLAAREAATLAAVAPAALELSDVQQQQQELPLLLPGAPPIRG